ncbi:MAG: hypothetical protein EG825_01285 [Rhodocyclaceae bacterium]|nr:hypothetical protein [Rhodocyclaceae bacterium]
MSMNVPTPIPRRAETLEILRLMGDCAPILMLTGGDGDKGFGTRWTLHGQQIQPGIARYLMDAGYIAETGVTEFGAHKLNLTPAGIEFRAAGQRWWSGLGFIERLWTKVFG